MSTRATIAVKVGRGIYNVSYIHFDGHVDRTGSNLITYWNTPERAKELISFGNCRSVGKDKEECEPYKQFHRQQGVELEVAVRIGFERLDAKYFYYYDGKDWRYTEDGKKFKKIPKSLIKEDAVTESYYRDYETLEELSLKESRDYNKNYKGNYNRVYRTLT